MNKLARPHGGAEIASEMGSFEPLMDTVFSFLCESLAYQYVLVGMLSYMIDQYQAQVYTTMYKGQDRNHARTLAIKLRIYKK